MTAPPDESPPGEGHGAGASAVRAPGSVARPPGRRRLRHVGLLLGGLAALAVVGGVALLLPRDELPPDFEGFEQVPARKAAFFAFLAPRVAAANARVAAQRQRLLALEARVDAGERLGWLDRRWLDRLAREYEVLPGPEDAGADAVPQDAPALIAALKPRVDTVPVALALVQAAAESGWGRSRFAREAFNYFGQWCFRAGCGVVPARRAAGRTHEVATFASPDAAVESYLHNLNTHGAYAALREIRARLRAAGEAPRAAALADGLVRYSERRQAYVAEIKTLLRVNRPFLEQAVRDTGPP